MLQAPRIYFEKKRETKVRYFGETYCEADRGSRVNKYSRCVSKIRKGGTKEHGRSVNTLSDGRSADTVYGILEPVREAPTSIFRSRESP